MHAIILAQHVARGCGYSGRLVGNAEVTREPSNVPSRPELVSRKSGGHFKSERLNRLWGCRGTDRRCREIKSVGEDNSLRFAGFSVYKCFVVGARGTMYNVLHSATPCAREIVILALAFFCAPLDQDTALANKIVAIDDPDIEP